MEDKYNLLPLSEETLRYMVEDLMTALQTTATLRDQLAMSCMTGLLSDHITGETYQGNTTEPIPSLVADRAYELADAMMRARE